MHHYFSFFKLINYFWLCWVFTVAQAFSSSGKQGFIVVLLNAVTSPLCSSVSKASACNAGDLGSISGSGRSPGEGNSNLLQYFYLENSMDRGDWQTVHGVTQSRKQLSDWHFHFKCTINVIYWNHPQTTPHQVHVKTVFHETSPWCQKGLGLLP